MKWTYGMHHSKYDWRRCERFFRSNNAKTLGPNADKYYSLHPRAYHANECAVGQIHALRHLDILTYRRGGGGGGRNQRKRGGMGRSSIRRGMSSPRNDNEKVFEGKRRARAPVTNAPWTSNRRTPCWTVRAATVVRYRPGTRSISPSCSRDTSPPRG